MKWGQIKNRNEVPLLQEKPICPTKKLHNIYIQTPKHLHMKLKQNR